MVRADLAPQTLKAELISRLEAVRAKTLWLLDQVPEEFLRRRVHSFYSPIGWHFGHVGRTEEFWSVGEAMGQPLLDDHLSFLFSDTPENPKDNRVNIPDRAGIKRYLAITRERALDALSAADLEAESLLLRNGYAWDFAVQHECQHQETICEMLQLIQRELGPRSLRVAHEWKRGVASEMVKIPGGEFVMGSRDPFAYDNEKQPHRVQVKEFLLGKTPVTAFDWSEFIADGGYARQELWSSEGFAWKEQEQADRPEYWLPLSQGYFAYGPLGVRAIHPDEPVSSISHHEAEAFARWSGKRLPTEAEWEYAASAGVYPWGDAEPDVKRAAFGMNSWGPQPVGAHALGANGHGVLDLAGNVWEWTSSRFLPYPGFQAYPYDGYSKDHMAGEHFVCRGGSWATAGPILRRTFRNWYIPGYRQGLLGMRLAESV
ncbi:MAG: gamma-glutamyl hercynylcysteine S-oxide synthase [Fimbriimonadaceae bacterium]|jgi:iron(II)-dependent oxidoreductase|nr:gamma-glutamyl hercynylcysteine S-oxide synthase [Fimbriimonadaceae bacterium]